MFCQYWLIQLELFNYEIIARPTYKNALNFCKIQLIKGPKTIHLVRT